MKQQKKKQPPAARRQPPSPKRPSAVSWMPWLALLLGVTAAVYLPMLKNQFTGWDDTTYIVNNPYIKSLTAAHLNVLFTQPVANNYHPLAMLSLALNYAVSGLHPGSYYAINLLLHLLNTVLVFLVIRKLAGGNIHVALFSAVFFAVHPLHVESVAWISERKDVLYAFFFLAALRAYLWWRDQPSLSRQAVVWLLALCSMMSKPAAIILPLALLTVDVYLSGRLSWRDVRSKIPLFLLAAFFLYMTWIAQQTNQARVADFHTFNVFERFLFACYGLLAYLVKYVVPVPQAAYYPYPEHVGWLYYLAPLGILALVAGVLRSGRHRRLLLFGLLFYVVNLVLVLQFVSIGTALVAERYTYMPYTSLFFVTGTWLFAGKKNAARRWMIVVPVALLFAAISYGRVQVWHSAETLWTDQVKKYPDHPFGYYNLGATYGDRGETDKALANYDAAIRCKPEYRSLVNRGAIFLGRRDYNRAWQDMTAAYAKDSMQHEASAGLAQVYLARGMPDSARYFIDRSLRIRPTYEAYFTRALIRKAGGDFEAAAADYREALRLKNDPTVHYNLANLYMVNLRDYAAAVREYDAAMAGSTAFSGANTYKGMCLYYLGRYPEAVSALDAALSINPGDAQALGFRSMTRLKSGDRAAAQSDALAAEKAGFSFEPGYVEGLRH